ncbi:hypothetical protein EDB81DRAFT_65095 [Dactylonectria macrodidyma]|uniref:Uncharacterized protein n=1 Tax=Dactylonectria macrodidyma TaxID=307937 RepID=A0A9P9EMF3_9HYPO|nr:hypothetical protein EDB81DRAFT_65095 [Dactylonectria macrodidyma]
MPLKPHSCSPESHASPSVSGTEGALAFSGPRLSAHSFSHLAVSDTSWAMGVWETTAGQSGTRVKFQRTKSERLKRFLASGSLGRLGAGASKGQGRLGSTGKHSSLAPGRLQDGPSERERRYQVGCDMPGARCDSSGCLDKPRLSALAVLRAGGPWTVDVRWIGGVLPVAASCSMEAWTMDHFPESQGPSFASLASDSVVNECENVCDAVVVPRPNALMRHVHTVYSGDHEERTVLCPTSPAC